LVFGTEPSVLAAEGLNLRLLPLVGRGGDGDELLVQLMEGEPPRSFALDLGHRRRRFVAC